MLGLFVAVFKALFRSTRNDKPTVFQPRDPAPLAVLADTPIVKGILQDAEARGDQDYLDRFRQAREDHSRKCDHRLKTVTVSRPTLEGSPSTWGWKVDAAAQLAVIRDGLNDAIQSTVFDQKQSPLGPLPLTGHMMKEMFYDYHDKHPQLRNLPTSRRTTDELIWTIETSPQGANWKITLSTSLGNSIIGDASLASVEHTVVSRPASLLENFAKVEAPILSEIPGSPLRNALSLCIEDAELPPSPQCRPCASLNDTTLISDTVERRRSLQNRSTRHGPHWTPDAPISRLPRVSSRASISSISTRTSVSEWPSPHTSRPPSPAIRTCHPQQRVLVQSKGCGNTGTCSAGSSLSRPSSTMQVVPLTQASILPKTTKVRSAFRPQSRAGGGGGCETYSTHFPRDCPSSTSPSTEKNGSGRQFSSGQNGALCPPSPALHRRPCSQVSIRHCSQVQTSGLSRTLSSGSTRRKGSNSKLNRTSSFTTMVAQGAVVAPQPPLLRLMRSTTNLNSNRPTVARGRSNTTTSTRRPVGPEAMPPPSVVPR